MLRLALLCARSGPGRSSYFPITGQLFRGAGRSEPPTREIARQVSGVRRAIDGRDVTIRWVKAHVGHHLNEAADRLAVAARRNAVAGVCAATRTEIAQRIVAEMVAFDSVA